MKITIRADGDCYFCDWPSFVAICYGDNLPIFLCELCFVTIQRSRLEQ